MKPKILLVDDEEAILKQMRWALASDYTVFTASSEAEAISIYEKERPPVVTLDLSLDPHNPTDLAGLRLLEQILSHDPSTRAIVLTGHNDDSSALRVMRLGAFDYYTKPVRLDELMVMIKRGFHLHRLLRKAQQFDHTLRCEFDAVVGTSKTMEEASTDVNLKRAKRAIEIDFVKKALSRNRGVVSRAARELGISRVNLYELIEKCNIRLQEFKMSRETENSQIKTREIS